MRRIVACLLLTPILFVFWFFAAWLGQDLPYSGPAAREPYACLSYAPFERGQSPFVEGLVIAPGQIDRQVATLAKVTHCLRSYSVGQGLDHLPAAAERAGLKVLLGIWLGRDTLANEAEIVRALELAAQYPGTIEGIVVGNEVLLRKEMTAAQLAEVLDRVRAASDLPITYADVWENWLATPELAEHVDFATIHILPYWEDHPVAIGDAIKHVAEVRRAMGQRFEGLEILIGETGWPSAGRQRQGALPSPVNQATYLYGVLTLFHEEGWRYNLIEAFDQGWKRQLEGTVGGHWGLLDDELRAKFHWGSSLTNHPIAGLFAPFGWVIALLTVGIATSWRSTTPLWRSFVSALIAGVAVPYWLEQAWLTSQDAADWLRAGLGVLLGCVLPPLAALAMERDVTRPTLASILGAASPPRGWLVWCLAGGLVLSLALALPWALGLVFDPRYRDFTTAAIAPALAALAILPPSAGPQFAERVFAAALALSAAVILVNEGLANGQSILWCLTLALFAARLWPWRRGRA